jgi:hypothetical protein
MTLALTILGGVAAAAIAAVLAHRLTSQRDQATAEAICASNTYWVRTERLLTSPIATLIRPPTVLGHSSKVLRTFSFSARSSKPQWLSVSGTSWLRSAVRTLMTYFSPFGMTSGKSLTLSQLLRPPLMSGS